MKPWIKRNYYRLSYLKKNVKIGEGVLLNRNNYFEGWKVIGINCEVTTSKIGMGTYIADKSVIRRAIIGRFCSIGSNVQTGLGTHPAKVFVSTHPAFFSVQKQAGFSFVGENTFKEHIFIDDENKYVVEIGNDVWIGSNVIILDGLKIGDGAIIAAGSVVTKDVLPYAIVTGVPAKFLRLRFSEQQIEKLLKIRWWDWDFNKIKANINIFQNIELLTSTKVL